MELASLGSQLDDLQAELAEAHAAVKQAQSERKQAQDKANELEVQLATQAAAAPQNGGGGEVAKLQLQLEEKTDELEKLKRQHRRDLDQVKEELADARLTVKELETKSSQLQASLIKVTEQSQAEQHEKLKLETKLKTLRRQSSGPAEGAVAKLEATIKELQTQNRELADNLDEATTKLKSTEKRATRAEDKLHTLEIDLTEVKNHEATLTRKNELLTSAQQRSEQQLEQLEDDLERKDKEWRALRSKVAQLQVDLEEAQENAAEAAKRQPSAEDQQAASEAKSLLETKTEENTKLRAKLKQIVAEHHDLQDANDDLEDTVVRLRAEIKNLQAQLDSLENDLEMQDIAGLRNAASEAKEELRTFETKYTSLQQAYDDSENTLSLTKSKLTTAQAETQALQDKLQLAEQGVTDLKNQVTSLEEQLQAVSAKVQQADTGAQERADQLASELENVQSRAAATEQKLVTMTERYEEASQAQAKLEEAEKAWKRDKVELQQEQMTAEHEATAAKTALVAVKKQLDNAEREAKERTGFYEKEANKAKEELRNTRADLRQANLQVNALHDEVKSHEAAEAQLQADLKRLESSQKQMEKLLNVTRDIQEGGSGVQPMAGAQTPGLRRNKRSFQRTKMVDRQHKARIQQLQEEVQEKTVELQSVQHDYEELVADHRKLQQEADELRQQLDKSAENVARVSRAHREAMQASMSPAPSTSSQTVSATPSILVHSPSAPVLRQMQGDIYLYIKGAWRQYWCVVDPEALRLYIIPNRDPNPHTKPNQLPEPKYDYSMATLTQPRKYTANSNDNLPVEDHDLAFEMTRFAMDFGVDAPALLKRMGSVVARQRSDETLSGSSKKNTAAETGLQRSNTTALFGSPKALRKNSAGNVKEGMSYKLGTHNCVSTNSFKRREACFICGQSPGHTLFGRNKMVFRCTACDRICCAKHIAEHSKQEEQRKDKGSSKRVAGMFIPQCIGHSQSERLIFKALSAPAKTRWMETLVEHTKKDASKLNASASMKGLDVPKGPIPRSATVSGPTRSKHSDSQRSSGSSSSTKSRPRQDSLRSSQQSNV
eukprot:TRINITY_DN10225_c0_g1_i2.p1 TRINITY_DN10225_c0_g1~~TRINITY_DN10225_c0_g1_i2.p1  ORF type:complete len:1076 (+),score=384.46 TRINITY_DN10225_c0_g1_i2:43-3228(+)